MHLVRTICNSLVQSLERIIPRIKRSSRGTTTASAVHRRIEVTVERESVSVWVRGPSAGGAEGVTTVTVNALVDRKLPSGSGPKEEPVVTKAVTAATPSDANRKFFKGGD